MKIEKQTQNIIARRKEGTNKSQFVSMSQKL
jgi:hypothetical protein